MLLGGHFFPYGAARSLVPDPVLHFILALCGFSGALATRLFDLLITSIAADFATPVSVIALLSSAFALPFGLSQPFLGPTGDAFGKEIVIKVAVAVLALCLLASALAPNLRLLFVSRVLGGVAAGGIMPVCMALIGDRFPLAVRQIALSRFIGATLIGQLVGASAGACWPSGLAGVAFWAVRPPWV